MPTYQYACTECSEQLEAVQSFSDPALTECPVCGGRLRKVFSAVGVVFKGSGFYKTDSRKGGASGEGSGSDKGAEKSSDKGSDKGSADKGSGSSTPATSGSSTSSSGNGSGSGSGSGGPGSGGGKAPATAGAKRD